MTSEKKWVKNIILSCLLLCMIITCTKDSPVSSHTQTDPVIKSRETSFIHPAYGEEKILEIIDSAISALQDDIDSRTQKTVDSLITYSLAGTLPKNSQQSAVITCGTVEADSIGEMGLYALFQGQYELAAYTFLEVARQYPSCPIYISKAAAVLRIIEKWRVAKELLLFAAELDDSISEVHANLGRIYDHEGDYLRSSYQWLKASADDPGNPLFVYYAALAYKEQGALCMAYQLLKRALYLGPDLSFIDSAITNFGDTAGICGGADGSDTGSQSPINLDSILQSGVDPNYTEPVLITDTMGMLMQANDLLFQEELNGHAQDYSTAEAEFNNEDLLGQNAHSICMQSNSESTCDRQYCARLKTALTTAIPELLGTSDQYNAVMTQKMVHLAEVGYSLIVRHPDALDGRIAKDLLETKLEGFNEVMEAVETDAASRVDDFTEITALACQQAAESIRDSIQAAIEASVPPFSFCLIKFCVSFDGSKISASMSLGVFFSGGISYDFAKNDFGVSLGIGLNQYAGIGLSLNSSGTLSANYSFKTKLGFGASAKYGSSLGKVSIW